MTSEDNASPHKKLVGVNEYARMRGVQSYAVRYAIKTGKLKEAVRLGPRNTYHIDPDIAAQEWPQVYFKREPAEVVGPGENIPSTGPASSSSPGGLPSIADSRARREAAEAQIAELKLDEAKGRLIDAAVVRREAFALARQVRDALMSVPDRISAELAAESDQFKVAKRITTEIRQALEELAGPAPEDPE